MTRRIRDERGGVTALVAVALVGLLAMAGLVIDGGRAYANRRQAQNAADVAAIAGVTALSELTNYSSNTKRVYDAVQESLTDNGATGAFTCKLIDDGGAEIQDCPTSNTPIDAAVTGVRVRASDQEPTSFMKVVKVNSYTVHGQAAASIKALEITEPAEFLLCAVGGPGGQPPGKELLVDNPKKKPGPLPGPNKEQPGVKLNDPRSPWKVDTTKTGGWYDIHGPHVAGCGAGPAFKGLRSGPFTQPGWNGSDTGVKAGPTRSLTGKLCADLATGCVVAIPLCTDGAGNGASAELYCVGFGAFEVRRVAANRHQARFLGPITVTSGKSGGPPVEGVPRVVKLTE